MTNLLRDGVSLTGVTLGVLGGDTVNISGDGGATSSTY